MYTNRRYTIGVRDRGAGYGVGPFPAEAYPAAGVLDDLKDAADADITRILARYAALRAWLAREEGTERAVRRHAFSAARRHLDATDADWSEKPLLAAALRARKPVRRRALLERAAERAEAAGHRNGARALRQAAHRGRWREAEYRPPSPS